MSTVEIHGRHATFGGETLFCSHPSDTCGGTMRFSLFLPPGVTDAPVFYWLSGLTCTEENFMAKAGAQRRAAELGLAIVAPDTSPRDTGIPGEDQDWDLGSGAGFYVDATQAPWSGRYRMESWVAEELPTLLAAEFPLDMSRIGISGHSMGGHGALVLSLRHGGRFRSVSAFSPICSPTNCPWGHKAFTAYLGEDREQWKLHDACELIARTESVPELLVDQGLADPFLEEQLRPECLEAVCAERGVSLSLRRHEAYDHSYYFVSTFIADHLEWHARKLSC